MKQNDFYKHLQEKKPLHSLYWLYGEETFLLQEALERIERKVFGPDDSNKPGTNLNYDLYYAGDTSGQDISNTLDTLPFMSEKRLVVIKQGHLLKEKDTRFILPFIEAKQSSTILVILSEKIDKRISFTKTFSKNGNLIEFKRPFDNDFPQWIQYLAKKQSVTISPMAAQTLFHCIGPNLLALNNEIQKITPYLGKRTNIEVEDIESVASDARVDSIFDLTEAIAKKNFPKASELLRRLFNQGESHVGMLALITRQFHILIDIKAALEKGLHGADISRFAGIPPFFAKKYIEQSSEWSKEALCSTLGQLHKADCHLKTSTLPPQIVLEDLVLSSLQL